MIGLVGLGLVGSALAERFRDAGHELVGYDVDGGKLDAFAQRGNRAASSPAEVSRQARRVVLSLPNSDVVNAVVEGSGGLLDHARSGDIVVDTTTADPVMSTALADRLRQRGIGFLDATILGSSRQVRAGEVLVMVGGGEADVDACADLLSAFARRVFPMGANGKGAQAKLVVNLVLGLNRLVLAEGLVLGAKAGMDPDALLAVLRDGAAYSRVMDTKGEKMIRGEFSAEGKLEQHLKDVGLILDLGAQACVPLPLSALHAQLLRAGVAAGFGEEDNSAIIKVLQRLASADPHELASARANGA